MKRTSLFANFLLKFNLEGFSNHCDSRIAFDFIHKFKLFLKSTCIMLERVDIFDIELSKTVKNILTMVVLNVNQFNIYVQTMHA